MTSASSLKEHIIEHEILGITSGGGSGDSLFELNPGGIVELITNSHVLRLDELEIGETDDVILSKDIDGNLVLEDANAGPITLTALKSMRNIWIEALSQPQGNITLTDATNWNAQYSFISAINVQTTSTNWDLWIHENSSFDTASIRSRRIVRKGSEDVLVPVGFEVNSSTNSLYLTFTPNSGTHSASFYVTGEARRH